MYERMCVSPLRCAHSRITDNYGEREVNILPNIKSAKKRVKVIATKTLRNQMFKSQLRTSIKKFLAAVQTGNKAEAEVLYKAAIKKVDQAVSHGILHKNTAAHRKSRFTKMLNAMN